MFNKILVPLDLEDQAGAVKTLMAVLELASKRSEIYLITVLAGYQMPMVASYFPKEMKVKALALMEKELQALGKKVLNGTPYTVSVEEGSPHKVIVEKADEVKADLILMSAQKHAAVEKMMLGSVSAKVSERAPCSVLLLRE